MSTWDIIEQVIAPQAIQLRPREAYVVQEAMTAIVKSRLATGGSAWPILEGLMAEGPEQMAVTGLDPHEVEIIKAFRNAAPAKVKSGNSGEVMMLDPKSWQMIAQEIESNKDYYNMLLGGVADADGLVQKIRSRLGLQMGQKPANAPKAPVQSPPELSGKPSDMTPSVQGAEQYGNATPFSSRSSSRSSRVAAQDMAMMGAKGKGDVDRMTKSGKMKFGEGLEGDLEEAFGKWAKAAGAAGALAMGGHAMADDPQYKQPVEPASFNLPAPIAKQKPPTQGVKVIDYNKGYKPQPGDYDPNDPSGMGGLQPEKKPWSNESLDEDVQGGVLTKKTGRTGSISLTEEEWQMLLHDQIQMINVVSKEGKPIKKVPGNVAKRSALRGAAFLRQAEDNPEAPHYWVLKI